MQGRGADHAVRESCDRARTGRGTASRRSTSESPPSDEGAGERSGGASARFRWQPRSTAAALRACRRPRPSHVAIASGVNHRVTSPRWTSARSYAGQFPTRYFVLYLGCTLDFTSRSCPFGRHDGQGRDEHLFPRTNASERASSTASRLTGMSAVHSRPRVTQRTKPTDCGRQFVRADSHPCRSRRRRRLRTR